MWKLILFCLQFYGVCSNSVKHLATAGENLALLPLQNGEFFFIKSRRVLCKIRGSEKETRNEKRWLFHFIRKLPNHATSV